MNSPQLDALRQGTGHEGLLLAVVLLKLNTTDVTLLFAWWEVDIKSSHQFRNSTSTCPSKFTDVDTSASLDGRC